MRRKRFLPIALAMAAALPACSSDEFAQIAREQPETAAGSTQDPPYVEPTGWSLQCDENRFIFDGKLRAANLDPDLRAASWSDVIGASEVIGAVREEANGFGLRVTVERQFTDTGDEIQAHFVAYKVDSPSDTDSFVYHFLADSNSRPGGYHTSVSEELPEIPATSALRIEFEQNAAQVRYKSSPTAQSAQEIDLDTQTSNANIPLLIGDTEVECSLNIDPRNANNVPVIPKGQPKLQLDF